MAATEFLTTLFCTDEDLAIEAPGDFWQLVPAGQKFAKGTAGSFSSGDRWRLASTAPDPEAQGVAAGQVARLYRPASRFPQPELFGVVSVEAGSVLLRRVGLGTGVGEPPAPAGGLLAVEFEVGTMTPQIEAATYELMRDFNLDDQVPGRRVTDLYSARELARSCVHSVLAHQYLAMAREAGADRDVFLAKAGYYRDLYDAQVARTTVHLRNAGPGESEARVGQMRVIR